MKNKNGFIATSIIYSFFIVFLMLLTMNLASLAQDRILMAQVKKDIKSDLELKFEKKVSVLLCKKTVLSNGNHNNSLNTYFGNTDYDSNGLIIGNAFDCDVNGDNIFDSKLERFYYLSDTAEGKAVLVYSFLTYENHYNSYVSSSDSAALTTYKQEGQSIPYNWPNQAIKNLPTVNDWTNPLLATYNDIQLTADSLQTGKFSYKINGISTAARLLRKSDFTNKTTNQSICNSSFDEVILPVTVSLDCNFLKENLEGTLSNGPTRCLWLEDRYSPISELQAWTLCNYSTKYDYNRNNIYNKLGVKPVIEVDKSYIEGYE